ncbi:Cell division ATP-binding protein FtsE [Candidatus Bealeia paramacronuclearis]|uniref:Cell division ATP-binding protein FtsE n=1 Tax=Candidatus Bealeia paramacronuclearis TaxID=1921001 RepID=A0ABZ2C366_9PROT|nr:Cell division ATP-binding protein FtsE [Candidatus Bealeia paramacronuclearis]
MKKTHQSQHPEITVKAEGLGISYDGKTALLKSVNFSLPKGSFHFLTGPSGSGKSSLLKMLYLGLRPTWGKLHLFGRDTSLVKFEHLPSFRQRLGVVFQEFNLLDHMTVLENVSLPLRVRGLDSKEARIQAEDLLKWVGLQDFIYTYPNKLSGGQKQRVAIARAVIARPQLLLADEPTGNVDDEMALKLIHLFEELLKLGTTILIATHNREMMTRFPYPELRIDNGALLQIPSIKVPSQKVVNA